MRNPMTKTTLTAAILASAMAFAGATSASAGVTSCSASGGKQEGGAVVGALLGGLIGHSVGGRHATGETVVGAAAGAAAGSAIGCEAQKTKAQNAGYGQATYKKNGYRLSSAISPASYDRIDRTFAARSAVNLRAAPTTNSGRVGRLQSGERFQALAQVRGSDWILVGQDGVGVGYVRGDVVRPVGQRYAAY
jgi:uncharacterized protein YgiM (DUF1202 family)